MSANLDKSLDDIIRTSSKRYGRPSGNSGRSLRHNHSSGAKKAALAGSSHQNVSTVAVPKSVRAQPVRPDASGSKIIVSNLPVDVTEAQVKELFNTTVGPVRRVSLSFRPNGQSAGQVTVEFQRSRDALRAFQQYNSRLIDGQKAIRIEVVVNPTDHHMGAPSAPLTGRMSRSMAHAPQGATLLKRPNVQGDGRGRRSDGGGRRFHNDGDGRPQKSVHDLDAEMDDYVAVANKMEV